MIETLEGRVFLSASVGASATAGMASGKLAPSAQARVTPFARSVFGTGSTAPGLIQAENFDKGGQRVSYLDTTTRNEGGVYRNKEAVDIYAFTNSPSDGGYEISSTHAGEWMEYTVTVPQSANYNLSFRVGSTRVGGTFHLNVDGRKRSANLTVPATGRGETFAVVNGGAVSLTAGTHVLRLAMDGEGGSGMVGRFDWISLALLPPSVPSNLTAVGQSDGSIDLSWKDVAGNASSFKIERTSDVTGSGGWIQIASNKGNQTGFNDQATAPGTTYLYRVRSTNGATVSAYSANASATTGTQQFDGPLVITQGGTYSGNWQSLDADTPAVSIQTDEPVIIENSNIRSAAACIDALGSNVNLTVRNTSGVGLNPNVRGRYVGRFMDIDGFSNVVATHNYMESTSGIYVFGYEGNHTAAQSVKVLNNVCKNVDGRVSDGNNGFLPIAPDPDYYRQFFQINGVSALVGAEVAWNQVVNEQGKSRVEENINISTSTGTARSPFLIHDNYIQGGFPANDADAVEYTGGGIMASDNGSAYIRVYNNEIVNTGGIGIEISSGHDNAIYNNRILSSGLAADGSRLAFSNTAVVIWNFNSEPDFANNSGHDNVIGWVNGDGDRNDTFIPDASSWVRNTELPDPINRNTEAAEFVLFQQKLSTADMTVGPVTG